MNVLWLRQTLRFHDNASLNWALAQPEPLLILAFLKPSPPLAEHLPLQLSHSWQSLARQQALVELAAQLAPLGHRLWVWAEPASKLLPALCQDLGVRQLITSEDYDLDQQRLCQALAQQGVALRAQGDNQLLAADQVEYPSRWQGRFTAFYRAQTAQARPPLPAMAPAKHQALAAVLPPAWQAKAENLIANDQRFALPVRVTELQAWCQRYFHSEQHVRHYRQSRNALQGLGNFSGLSAGLALGTLSSRQINQHLHHHEQQHGANESTQALRYELYWRQYFHELGRARGPALFGRAPLLSASDHQRLMAWCAGQSDDPLVNAIMTELRSTGFVSNRSRQLAASYLVHDLQVDWRFGAAWFEHCLLDYDVNSNYGNWAYIAGHAGVSAQPHRFDLAWQRQQHDPDGQYQRAWAAAKD